MAGVPTSLPPFVFSALLALLLVPETARAEPHRAADDAPTTGADTPAPDGLDAEAHAQEDILTEVHVGTYVNRIREVDLADPAERIAHDRPARGALRFRIEVLELAAAAAVAVVVGAAGVDSPGTGRLESTKRCPRESLLPANRGEPGDITGRRAGHEDGAPILEPSHPIATGGNPLDGDDFLVTEHGWTGCIDHRAGFEPSLRDSSRRLTLAQTP